MLSWNDADLARIRSDELLREAERERLAAELRPSHIDPLLDPLLESLRGLGPRLVPVAIAAGLLAFALR